ncbi:MAG: hypothetical protein ACI8QY_000870 [bacterium]|jgi:hypothetical protein
MAIYWQTLKTPKTLEDLARELQQKCFKAIKESSLDQMKRGIQIKLVDSQGKTDIYVPVMLALERMGWFVDHSVLYSTLDICLPS